MPDVNDLNIDWAAAAHAENGTMIATGRDSEFSVVFYMGKVPNFDMTDYVEVPHIRLQAPGSKTVYDQPVRMESFPSRPSDPERFPRQWAAFQRGENISGAGTLLHDWEEISPGDIRKLDLQGIHTVEQLAAVADVHLDGLGFGGRLIREKARAFLNGRGAPDPEKAEMRAQIGQLREMVELLLSDRGDREEAAPLPEPLPNPEPTRQSRGSRQPQEA